VSKEEIIAIYTNFLVKCGRKPQETEPTWHKWVESEEEHPKPSNAHHRSVSPSFYINSLVSFPTVINMSSFRNHRVVIASLFLPTIAVIEESIPPTPEQPYGHNLDSTISAVADRLAANIAVDPIAKSKQLKAIITTNIHHRQPSASSPLKSIVEDLKDKVYVIFTPQLFCHSLIVIRAAMLHPIVHRLTKPLVIRSQSSPGSQQLPRQL
jgi:hypothetical protein